MTLEDLAQWLCGYVAAYPQARSLMRRVVRTWLQSL